MALLDGKTALVTGAGRGIGRGIAIALAKAGAKVVVNDLGTSLAGEGTDAAPAQQVVDEITKAGGTAQPNFGSVADWTQAHGMVEQAVKAWGRIDILVNVAGILRDRMIFNMNEDEWDIVMAVHAKGTFNCTRAASVHMRQQQGGRIVSMSSVSALGSPGQPNYAAAKAAILGLTWSTANAMAKYNVTANAVLPSGATRMIDSTPRGQTVLKDTGKLPSEQAVGTERDPDNVAPLVVYLSSDAAAKVNGQVFHVRGYSYSVMAQPHELRAVKHTRKWDPEELGRAFDKTLGGNLSVPPGINLGAMLEGRGKGEWQDMGGYQYWQAPWEPPAKS